VKKRKKDVEIKIFKNSAGGAELYCSPDKIPEEINGVVNELRINLFSQYSDIFKNLKKGKKENFIFSHKHKGFTIIFSSIFD